jgi:hypothetical protein
MVLTPQTERLDTTERRCRQRDQADFLMPAVFLDLSGWSGDSGPR